MNDDLWNSAFRQLLPPSTWEEFAEVNKRVKRLTWKGWAKFANIKYKFKTVLLSGWDRWAMVRCKSFELRSFDQNRLIRIVDHNNGKRVKRHSEGYSTKTWKDAIARLFDQASRRLYYHKQCPWERWCASVVKKF